MDDLVRLEERNVARNVILDGNTAKAIAFGCRRRAVWRADRDAGRNRCARKSGAAMRGRRPAG
jgi:hypothetical protein